MDKKQQNFEGENIVSEAKLTAREGSDRMIEKVAASSKGRAISSVRANADDFDPLFLLSDIEVAAHKVCQSTKHKHSNDYPKFNFLTANDEKELSAIGRFCHNKSEAGVKVLKLYADLALNRYNPNKYTGFIVRKSNGKPRTILAPSVRDRIVFTAILNKIKPNFGFLNKHNILGSGTNERLKNPKRIFNDILEKSKGYDYVLKVDIKNFFPSIEKDRLYDELSPVIDDSKMINLIKICYSTEIYFTNKYYKPSFLNPLSNIGIPQGCAFSPLMANFYFYNIDAWLKQTGYLSYRYLDDLLVYCRNHAHAERAFKKIKIMAEEKGLEVHALNSKSTKSYIKRMNYPYDYLGIEIEGSSLSISEKCFKKLLTTLTEDICNDKTIELFGMEKVYEAMKNYLKHWRLYYKKICGKGCYDNSVRRSKIDNILFDLYIEIIPSDHCFLLDEKQLYLDFDDSQKSRST